MKTNVTSELRGQRTKGCANLSAPVGCHSLLGINAASCLYRTGTTKVSLTVADRKDALATAVAWAGQGRSGMMIIGRDGRIYTLEGLAMAIINEEEQR
jgi:hypothetical protein